MKRLNAGWILLLMLIPLAGLQAQEMYTWTDENGVIHYSDIKPAHLEVEASDIPEIPASGGDNPYNSAPDANSEAERRREELAENRAANQQLEAVRRSQCESWQSEIARLEPNRRVFIVNEQGETERMDDVARVDRVARLKDMVSENCNGL